jgi:hypothetical protein
VVLEDGVHAEDPRIEVVRVGRAMEVVALELPRHREQGLVAGLEVALRVPGVAERLEHHARVELVLVVVVVEAAGRVPVEQARAVLHLPLPEQSPELDSDVTAAGELAGEEIAVGELLPVGRGQLLPPERDLELAHRDLESLVAARVPVEDEVLQRAGRAGAGLGAGPAQLQLVGELAPPHPARQLRLGPADAEAALRRARARRSRKLEAVVRHLVRPAELHAVEQGHAAAVALPQDMARPAPARDRSRWIALFHRHRGRGRGAGGRRRIGLVLGVLPRENTRGREKAGEHRPEDGASAPWRRCHRTS